MIKLNDGCYVDANDVSQITINPRADLVTVRMKNGIGHDCEAGRGGVYALAAHIADQVDREMRRNTCHCRDDHN
jgi:hypothetical protein